MTKLTSKFSTLPVPRSFLALLVLIIWMISSVQQLEVDANNCLCNGKTMSEARLARHRGITMETLRLLKTRLGMTMNDICAIPAARLERAIANLEGPEPDQPDEALRFRLMQLQDETGTVKPDGLVKAAQHVALVQGYQRALLQPTAALNRYSWTWIGPGNIGGRIRTIVFQPNNANNIWVGSVSGGIWKSTDGGAGWQPVNDFLANLAVSTMIIAPDNPSTMYAGTGEGFYNYDAIRGAGVFKSTDGGGTWTQLSSTANSSWYYVNRLAVSADGSKILAATNSGIWRTTDAGLSWAKVSPNRALDVDFDLSNGNNAVAGGMPGAWSSTDGGLSWTAAANIPTSATWPNGRCETAYAPSNSSIVYASVDANQGDLYRSTDGGHSFARTNTGKAYLGSQGWYDNVLWVDPTNANFVVVGGIDVWRSTDGGVQLTKISQWYSAPDYSAHADHHAIVQHPGFNGSSNTTVFFGNDGGIYRAGNIYTVSLTSGWQELNNNLGITQFYGAAGSPNSKIVIGGTQDNGTPRYGGTTEGWTTLFGGDGGFCASDPTNPNYFYGEYTFLHIFRSTNAGVSASYVYSGIADASDSHANFIAPFILDPNNPNTMLAGGASLWRSTNIKAPVPAWSAIKSASGTNNVSTIAVAKGNSDIIWVGHNNGDVYKTADGTAAAPTWTKMDDFTGALPNRAALRITIDPVNSNIVYATFGGFNADNVYKTTNGGTNWFNISGSGLTALPAAPVRSLVVNPENSGWIYAGTEVGVFASEVGGTTWSIPTDGPANVAVDELFWMNKTLVAATHGRGLFRTSSGATTRGVFNDFDADRKSDAAVFRPSNGIWYVLTSSAQGAFASTQWGLADDQPVQADYDGDDKTDVAVWRPATGTWYVIRSATPGSYIAQQWGVSSDKPFAADFDGDGKADIAVWRPATGTWYVQPSSVPGTFTATQWGASTDIPVPADYDGDNKTDIAVWRPSTGAWYILPSASPGTFISTQWGFATDLPVPGNYDGDSKADIAVWRPGFGLWYILPSAFPGTYTSTQWGLQADTPVPGDYDGDGKTDIAVWRPGSGVWFILPSASPGTYTGTQWGLSTDLPLSSITRILSMIVR